MWVVNPKWRSVSIYRSAADIRTLTENDQLTGEDVLPGFACRVGDIFTSLYRASPLAAGDFAEARSIN